MPRRDPRWRSGPGSALIGWWWAFYVASIFRFGIGANDGNAGTRDELRSVRTEDIVAALAMAAAVGAAILLIQVVRRLTQRQARALGLDAPVG